MKKLSILKKREKAGFGFVSLWLIGLLIFFNQPVTMFLYYSFFKFTILPTGGYALERMSNVFQNYIDAWKSDAQYPVRFVSAFQQFAYKVPIIVFFSLFMALLLNQKFKGRAVMRAIFFLPIITTSGCMGLVISRGISAIDMGTVSGSSTIYDVSMLKEVLVNAGLAEKIVTTLTDIVANVADLVWDSGVQILIFMIGLLAIPESYYEAANVEGATGWEAFWKITFPVISPFILANLVYTFITACMETGNGVIDYVIRTASENMDYSFASAMLWMYFLTILLIIGVILLLCKRAGFVEK